MSLRLNSWAVNLSKRFRQQVDLPSNDVVVDCDSDVNNHSKNKMKNAFKVVVLGSPRVGKTTIIEEAIYGTHYRLNTPYEPTIEDIYCAIVEYDRNSREKLYLYDYAGIESPINQENTINALKMYLSFCDAFILVFAINDPMSFTVAANLKKNIEKIKDKKDIPIVMVANKMDKMNESKMNLDEIKKWAAQEKVKLIETKATDRESISECFTYLASKLIVSKSSFSRKSKTGSLQLEL